jgi:hypothetical protein
VEDLGSGEKPLKGERCSCAEQGMSRAGGDIGFGIELAKGEECPGKVHFRGHKVETVNAQGFEKRCCVLGVFPGCAGVRFKDNVFRGDPECSENFKGHLCFGEWLFLVELSPAHDDGEGPFPVEEKGPVHSGKTHRAQKEIPRSLVFDHSST